MIDAKLLRQLGWSEALIKEVTRVAGEIGSMIGGHEGVREPAIKYGSESGNKIFFETPEINASVRITVSDFKKP